MRTAILSFVVSAFTGLAFSLVERVDVGVIGVGLLWAAPVAGLVAVGVIVWRRFRARARSANE